VRHRIIQIGAAVIVWISCITPLAAHNQSIHQQMTDLAYQMMVFTGHPGGLGRLDAGDADWTVFLQRVAATPVKYNAQSAQLDELAPPKWIGCSAPQPNWRTTLRGIPHAPSWDFNGNPGCGVNWAWKPSLDYVESDDFIGATLGLWAATPDDEFDDTHLWYRPTNVLGVGAVRDVVNEATEDSLSVVLLPVVCVIDLISGNGNDCHKDAKKIANDVDVGEEIDGWIPGFNDISNADYVGLWHFIDMNPDASNEFDARQGKLFDEAGVPGEPMDPVEVVLMAYFDVSGLSVDHDKSEGVSHYTIDSAEDGVPVTTRRDKSQWQFTSIAHVPFEPVSNLAYYGWERFRDEQVHPIRMLAWPLHAIGDATVPMHVIGSSAWGHRPFEDSQEELWPKIWNFTPGQLSSEQTSVLRVMRRAFDYWKMIEAWRAAHGGNKDVPVRQIVNEVARHTHQYAMSMHQVPGSQWPFSITASTEYLLYPHATAHAYAQIPGAADLVRPLFEDGVGATIALLVAAADYL
jgi:hypothetical protein